MSAPGEAPRSRRVWHRVLGAVLAAAALAYFVRELAQHWPAVLALSWTRALSVALALAVGIQLLSTLLDAWSWAWLLRALGVAARSRDAMGAFLVAQFAKYVPGNVGQHIGRVGFARAHGWPTGPVVLSLLTETGFAFGAGALVAGAGLLASGASGSDDGLGAGIAIALVVAGWAAGTLVLRRLLATPPEWLARFAGLDRPVELKKRVVVAYLFVHIASYVALGVALALLTRGLAGDSGPEIWRAAVAAVVAWLVGRVPGAPAGLGAREATVTALLTPLYGSAVAVSAALLWRVSGLVSDSVMLGVGLILRQRAVPGESR